MTLIQKSIVLCGCFALILLKCVHFQDLICQEAVTQNGQLQIQREKHHTERVIVQIASAQGVQNLNQSST